jgi:two-component system, NtrC family, sensor kinase
MESKNYKICFICLIFCILYNPVMGQKTSIYQQQIDSIIKRQALNSNDSVRIVDMSNLTNYYFLQYDFTKGFSSLNQLKRMTYKPSPRLTDLYYYNSLKYFFWNYETFLTDFYTENITELTDKISKPVLFEGSVSPKVTEEFVRTQLYNALKSTEIASEPYYQALVYALLSESFFRSKNLDSLSYYGDEAINLYDKIEKREEAFCIISSKIIKYSFHNLDLRDSLKNEESKAINYLTITTGKKSKASMYERLGLVYDILRQHASTIQCHLKANEIWEELKEKRKQIITLLKMANYSGLLKNHDKDREYALYALKLKKELNDTADIAWVYYQIIFSSVALKLVNEADKYAQLIRNNFKDTSDVFFYGKVLDAQGQVLKLKGNYKEAIDTFNKCADKFKQFGNTVLMSYPHLYIAICYDSLNQTDNSIRYAQMCYDESAKENWIENILNSSLFLSELYEKKGDLVKAHRYLSIYVKTKKQYDEKNESAKAADFETQDIINKNQKRIEQLQNDGKINTLTRNFTSGIASLLLLLAGGVYYRFKSKQRDNKILEKTLSDLKSTQTQLIQKEKLASLGELTAGIAHEIQNPLNFVNNFSELSVDLAKDLKEEIHKSNIDKEYVEELLTDLSQNQEKINHHGKRASSIVKGMLEHSRASTGVKEMTDINALADEYFRLSYHGLRAKDKDFNADFKTDFDENLPKINIIPQDMGRVLLNLFNNAFYAVHERQQLSESLKLSESYTPSVFLTTQLIDNQIVIKAKDNGTGMSESVRAKVFQPFFTTKPTGSGTGLGLSLAYDIVTKGHGGALEVESTEGVGTEFIVYLPTEKKLKTIAP